MKRPSISILERKSHNNEHNHLCKRLDHNPNYIKGVCTFCFAMGHYSELQGGSLTVRCCTDYINRQYKLYSTVGYRVVSLSDFAFAFCIEHPD